jgi:hypothetical protein
MIFTIKMKNEMENKSFLPPHGCITELQNITGYSRRTITCALRHNSKGTKAEKVREIFRNRYVIPEALRNIEK